MNKEVIEEIQRNAKEATRKSYAPYSKFHVGASLVTEKGNVYTACNVENASYGLTCCAERNTIFKAISEEGPGMRVKAIAITSNPVSFCSPCGACRQVISQFTPKEGYVYIGTPDGGYKEATIGDLLPQQFEFELKSIDEESQK